MALGSGYDAGKARADALKTTISGGGSGVHGFGVGGGLTDYEQQMMRAFEDAGLDSWFEGSMKYFGKKAPTAAPTDTTASAAPQGPTTGGSGGDSGGVGSDAGGVDAGAGYGHGLQNLGPSMASLANAAEMPLDAPDSLRAGVGDRTSPQYSAALAALARAIY